MTGTGAPSWMVGPALLLLAALAACGSGGAGRAGGDRPLEAPPAAQGDEIHVVGVIRHSDLEGGFYAIEASDGVTYDPTNLSLEFRKDGLPIEADLRRRNDMAGIHQRGPIVEIVRIQARRAPVDQPPAFANRVWKVDASSAVERGTLYVFLGDGTLLITSAHGTPSLGRWETAGAGLALVEEGLRHPADVLALTVDTFTIRVRSPGQPVDITFVPAR